MLRPACCPPNRCLPAMKVFTSGCCSALVISARRRETMADGVPVGRSDRNHL